MRGAGAAAQGGVGEKWLKINQVVRDSKVAILGLQETHLVDEKREELNKLFNLSMKVYSTADPENPSGARGVAIAINKRLVNTEETSCHVVVPGRALHLTVKWSRQSNMVILVIYAPNDPQQNENFWDTIQNEIRARGLAKPEILMGDFNIVESPMDRYPQRPDQASAVEALQRVCLQWRLKDEWRARYHDERVYTYLQTATGSQSRIDRLYMNPRMAVNAVEWETMGPGFATDHQLVRCVLTNRDKPYIGHGRWRMHSMLLTDTEFCKQVKEKGMKLQEALNALGTRSASRNPQMLYASFKEDVRNIAKARAKERVPKIERKIAAMREDMKELNKTATESNGNAEAACKAALLQSEIVELEVKRFGSKRAAVAARDWLEGETISKYWMRLNKVSSTDETVYELARPGTDPTEYATRSDIMAEIAKTHYDEVQKDDDKPAPEEHRRAIDGVIEVIERSLTEAQRRDMSEGIEYSEVESAIQEAANGKAPGLDGLPSELWKEMITRYKSDKAKRRPAFNIVAAMRDVYNDIVDHGTAPGTDFAAGWICPIYKKSDKRQISNYRPITLLNADYKILTKVLANRLAEVAGDLIHPDQAGFVPGRKIHHQTKLTKMVIDYCEAEEVNGAIIALDQEKAYDKVDHDYLWKVLERLNFPPKFINTIKALYKDATSVVAVNGVLSDSFEIVRGMRQGDPMSCILFDLAIEPLAEALRKSTLRGIELPGAAGRLITTLFADDTTAYLHEQDSYSELKGILQKWCQAARAKFNVPKTEVIPVGSREYRDRVRETRRLSPEDEPIEDNIRIVPEGVAVRSLGAWIGNGVDDTVPWEPIIKKIRTNLDKWQSRRPTLRGKKLIVGLEVGSRTQYLTRVQTMPKSVEDRLEKIIRGFVWDGQKRPPVSLGTLQKKVEEGGIGLLDIKARNEAIDLMWVKEYLNLAPSRPKWAAIADALFARATDPTSRAAGHEALLNPFLQTWDASTHHKRNLPKDLARLITTAKKYDVRVTVRNPDEQIKGLMPGWYHIGNQPGSYKTNTVAGRCLRANHGVRTVADAGMVALRAHRSYHQPGGKHRNMPSCKCYDCTRDREVKGCDNPSRCVQAAQRLIERLRQIWKPTEERLSDGLTLRPTQKRENVVARREGTEVIFNPTVSERAPLAGIFRVFGLEDRAAIDEPATRPRRGFAVEEEALTAYTDGSAKEGGERGPRAGSGIYCGDGHALTTAVRLPSSLPQTNQAAEVFAVSVIAARAPPFAPLKIVSDSEYVIDGLTKELLTWEEQGWIGVENSAMFKDAAARLRARSARTSFQWVKGHSGVPGNEAADKLADEGAEMDANMATQLPPLPKKYLAKGARMTALTQGLAYRGIKDENPGEERLSTSRMVQRIIATVTELSGARMTEAKLWTSLRSPDVARKVGDFLWRCLHDSLRIGKFWRHIAGYEMRAACACCGTEESIEHILVDCDAEATQEIRRLTKAVVKKRTGRDTDLALGEILGATAVTYKGRVTDETQAGALDRFFRIVVTESAYLIWKIRCERTIDRKETPERWHSRKEAREKWYYTLNKRLMLDRTLTSNRFGRKAVSAEAVTKTWEGILNVERNEQEHWLKLKGVLVGRLEQHG